MGVEECELKKDTIDQFKLAIMTTTSLMILIIILGILLMNSDGRVVINDMKRVKEPPAQWAVLVAGSKGWDNYRHQADVCHAYQVLHEHGLDDDHIIVMMYDDIAYNSKNPTKGKIINKPSGPNVYNKVPKDYTGPNVTPENFIAVLRGDRKALKGMGSGKVVTSGPNDHIFIYFADHGASGIVAFPSDFLDAQTLTKALQDMFTNKQYKQILFYLEACESGSMFEGLLPSNINILAVTASNSTAPSFACFYDEDLDTFLGDVFSVSWMEDSDSQNIQKETIKEQLDHTANMTSLYGEIGRFGDHDISSEIVSLFQGPKTKENTDYDINITDAIPAYEVPMAILEMSKDPNYEKVHLMKKGRKLIDDIIDDIVYRSSSEKIEDNDMIEEVNELRDYGCFSKVVREFHNRCFNLGENAYALRKVHVLANICGSQVLHVSSTDKSDSIIDVIRNVCNHPVMIGIN